MNIELPDALHQQLAERIRGTEFSSVDAYVQFIVEEVLKQTAPATTSAYSPEEEEKVKQRLSDLGYLD